MSSHSEEVWGLAPVGVSFPSIRRQGAPLAPLLAGARARGVADGLEWMGLAAVLLDDRGEVLHVNPGAVELMGEHLYLADGRLKAKTLLADLALGEAVRGALIEGVTKRAMAPEGEGVGAICIEVSPMPVDDDPFQLLRAVAILHRISDGRRLGH